MSKVLMFLKDEAGISAIEYALIAAGVSLLIFSAVTSLGTNLTAME